MIGNMRHIAREKIIQAVRDLCIEANCVLRPDTWRALKLAEKKEESPHGRMAIKLLLDNAEISNHSFAALCKLSSTTTFSTL